MINLMSLKSQVRNSQVATSTAIWEVTCTVETATLLVQIEARVYRTKIPSNLMVAACTAWEVTGEPNILEPSESRAKAQVDTRRGQT